MLTHGDLTEAGCYQTCSQGPHPAPPEEQGWELCTAPGELTPTPVGERQTTGEWL